MLDVLLVEDDEDVRECIASWLEDAGHRVTQASDGGRAASLLESRAFDLALCDVHLPTLDGLTLARRARHLAPSTAVVMMSSQATVSDVVSVLQAGALDLLVKPFDADRLVRQIVAPIAERRALHKRIEVAREEWVEIAVRARLVAASPQMRAVVERLEVVAQADTPVFIHGEKGTGRKTLATFVHQESPRRAGPLVFVPCNELAAAVKESDIRALAGIEQRDGWFRKGEGGTLVLCGIDRLAPSEQSAIARVLLEPTTLARRDASGAPRGVRVVAITESGSATKVVSSDFLSSLFRPLSAMVEAPPLRERDGDLLPLVVTILATTAPDRTGPPSIEPSAYAALAAYPFPGNVAELVWALKYALLMAGSASIGAEHLPRRFFDAAESTEGAEGEPAPT